MIDGDDLGVAARLQELAEQLEVAGIEPRGPAESIAVFIPTWSVETWLAHLCGVAGIDEDTALKDHAAARGLWKDGPSTKATLETAASAWHGGIPALPSLEAAYAEAPRVGLGSR